MSELLVGCGPNRDKRLTLRVVRGDEAITEAA